MPMFLAMGVIAEGVFLFFLVLCIRAGDILLDFALEDERFFELAKRCHALSIFEDITSALRNFNRYIFALDMTDTFRFRRSMFSC
jgi:hypothetical protein